MQFTCGITPLMVAESNTQGGCDTRYAFIIVLCPDPYPGGGGGGGGGHSVHLGDGYAPPIWVWFSAILLFLWVYKSAILLFLWLYNSPILLFLRVEKSICYFYGSTNPEFWGLL